MTEACPAPRHPSSYAAGQLDELARFIERRRGGIAVSGAELGHRLLDLLGASGRADDGSEYMVTFLELAGQVPSHAALAALFRRLAVSENPLTDMACNDTARAELAAAARNEVIRRNRANPEANARVKRSTGTALLAELGPEGIWAMASRLASYHQAFVRPGRPHANEQDTLLDGIADIFVEFAGLDCHRYELPHSTASHFIGFAHCALRPFFAKTEVSRKALSRRWKRLKDRHYSAGC